MLFFQKSAVQVEVPRNSLQKFMSDVFPSPCVHTDMVKFESFFFSFMVINFIGVFQKKLTYQTEFNRELDA